MWLCFVWAKDPTPRPRNITDLTLGEPQLKLAEAIEATGKPVVLVLVEGRPRIINRIVDKAGAVLMAYNPGNEGGQAVADVLVRRLQSVGQTSLHLPAHAERPDHLRSQSI